MATGNTLNLAAGTSGQVLVSQGTSSPPGYANATSVGGVILLTTKTANNTASTLDFTSVISSTYYSYRLFFSNVKVATSAASINMQFSTNNGSSWDTGSNYNSFYLYYNFTSSAAAANSVGSTIRITLTKTMTNTSVASGYVDIINPGTPRVAVTYQAQYENSTGPARAMGIGAGNYFANSAINAFRIITSSGNINTGTFKLYGMKA